MIRRAHKVRPPRQAPTPSRPAASFLVVHAAELVTLRGPAGPRTRESASELDILEDGAVYGEGERIVEVGRTTEILSRHPRAGRTLDASGKVVLPGFVDAHTHLVFAGSREREVEWKASELTYEEIAARGGGILDTVRATRAASEVELARATAERLRAALRHGTTTVEVKSGYGLRTEDEVKMLRAASAAAAVAGVDVVRTFLGAHAVPPEFEGRAHAYVDLVVNEMLPHVAREGLATFCDVFVERGYFEAEQGRRILQEASRRDLRAKVHADELSDGGGAALAGEMRAASADHLLHTSQGGIESLARNAVPAVLLPATSLLSKMPFADGRRLVDAGVPVALGTDFSPNCWCESLQTVVALACHHNGLTPAQAIVAATVNAAHAIGRGTEIGTLETGKLADLLVLDVPNHRHLGYRMGGNAVQTVLKKGRVVWSRD